MYKEEMIANLRHTKRALEFIEIKEHQIIKTLDDFINSIENSQDDTPDLFLDGAKDFIRLSLMYKKDIPDLATEYLEMKAIDFIYRYSEV